MGAHSKSISVFCVWLHGGLIRAVAWPRFPALVTLYECMHVGHWSADNATSDIFRSKALTAYVLAATI
jgi:hypothetical protein